MATPPRTYLRSQPIIYMYLFMHVCTRAMCSYYCTIEDTQSFKKRTDLAVRSTSVSVFLTVEDSVLDWPGLRCDATAASHQEHHGFLFNTKGRGLAAFLAFSDLAFSSPHTETYRDIPGIHAAHLPRSTSPSWTSSRATWTQRRCTRVFRGDLGCRWVSTKGPTKLATLMDIYG